jgi:alpha-ketoglutarate-dependent taurine dioxygenase
MNTAHLRFGADSPFVPSTLPQARGSLPALWVPRQSPAREGLCTYLTANRAAVAEALVQHGAILLRGFDIREPEHVEEVAAAFTPGLGDDYLGTSPRNSVTPRVFNASELPGFYPIPQHCEMSFIAHPPARLFFSCLTAPAAGSGETPITDFAAVARDLPADVRARFESKRLRIIRNYSGPGEAKRDLWQLKRWDEMFGTTDRAVVEARCRGEGFEPTWTPGDGLRLISYQDAFRDHPITGERVWFNHLQVFHLHGGPVELGQVFRHRPGAASAFWWLAAAAMAAGKSLKPAEEQAMHVTWEDGSAVSRSDLRAVVAAIWRNQVAFPWQLGDFLAIDNYRVSHGRLPYRGPRRVVVAWANEAA